MNRKKIYIASPYTIGDPVENVRRQIEAANELIHYGYAPYAPLLSHYIHVEQPQDWEVWMDVGLSFLKDCDGVLRLLGESKGADIEVQKAIELDIPVFYNIGMLTAFLPSE